MPMISPANAPPGESLTVLWTERSILIGKALTCIPYGMVLLLYLQCADALLYKKHRRDARKWVLFAYTTYILALATVSLGLALKWSEMIFIDDRNFPGGPSRFYKASYSDSGTVPMGFAYWSLTIFFNIGLTSLICARLCFALVKGLPTLSAQPNNLYEKVTDVLLESGAAYSICGILQLIAYGADYNGLRRLFQGPISQIQAVTTLLIVLRMGRGQAYGDKITSNHSPSALEQRITAQRPVVDVSGLPIESEGEKEIPSSATSETPLRPNEANRWQHIV
ncbi:hypothetical protein HWV62_21661 [Athelia sp. TMB]|nr:hypothetical protein HWV62_21661 [Athelia sp. TMB]